MWLFGNSFYISIVEDWPDPSMVFVRSRRESDIHNFMKNSDIPYEIKYTPDNDYHYRIHISKTMLSKVLENSVKNINYTNFKDSIDDESLYKFAAETWNSGYRNLAERVGRLF